jgi:hypothetical protein
MSFTSRILAVERYCDEEARDRKEGPDSASTVEQADAQKCGQAVAHHHAQCKDETQDTQFIDSWLVFALRNAVTVGKR